MNKSRQLTIIVYFFILLFIYSARLEAREELPNILLLTLDSCRPDHFSCYGYHRNTTPTIDKLAKEGVYFTHAFSQSAWTSPGMLSIFTSLYPPTHNVDTKGKTLSEDTPTLPKVLKKQGYATLVFSRFVEVDNYKHLGFDTIDKNQYLREGENLLKLIEDYKNQRFFIWYHFLGTHLPYNPHPPYNKLFRKDTPEDTVPDSEAISIIKKFCSFRNDSVVFSETDKNIIVALYDGLLRQVDDCIGRLIAKLEDWNILNNTLIIITADHGEELFEHGFLGHASTSGNAKLYDEIIHIPLIIWYPGKLKHRKVDELVQQIDIMPTILNILNFPIPENLQGNSLLPLLIKGKTTDNLQSVFCETILGGYQSTKEMEKIKLRCIRTNKWKLIYTNDINNDIYELYNLKKDPKEKNNIVKKYPDIANDLKNKLFHWIKTYTIENGNSIR